PVIVMDIKDCFFSIPLSKQDCKKFAFTLPSIKQQEPAKRYQWKVLPQGMKNSPVICQQIVAQVLEPVRKQHAKALILHYMDDILIAAENEEYLNEVEGCTK
ncbi:POK8 protein, partial [Ciconia maguari]|nr:POK8 protein [Ciconia maguari]